jgi:hypothetical protein
MFTLLSRAFATLTGHPLLPRWIQDIAGGAWSTRGGTEEGEYHMMAADGTTAARATGATIQPRVRANTGIVVTVHDDTMSRLVKGRQPSPQTGSA